MSLVNVTAGNSEVYVSGNNITVTFKVTPRWVTHRAYCPGCPALRPGFTGLIGALGHMIYHGDHPMTWEVSALRFDRTPARVPSPKRQFFMYLRRF